MDKSVAADARLAEDLIELGLISVAQLPNCLKYANRVGTTVLDSCVQLGLFTWEDFYRGLDSELSDNVFRIRTPEALAEMKNWITRADSLLRGVVVLGVGSRLIWLQKRKYLNVGLMDMSQEAAVRALVGPVLKKRMIDRVRFFRISPSEFQLSLYFLYNLKKPDIQAMDPHLIHPRLLLYLQSLVGL